MTELKLTTLIRRAVLPGIAAGVSLASMAQTQSTLDKRAEQQRQTQQQQQSQANEPVAATTAAITGQVTEIDRAQRQVAVRSADGRSATLAVGPNVPNFDTIDVGDDVTMRYRQAVAMAVAKGGVGTDELRARVQTDVARPLPGEAPGQLAMEGTTLVAAVSGIDRDRGILTVRGPDDAPVDIKVADPNALAQIERGDQLVIGSRQAAVVSIEPGANAAPGSSSKPADAGRSPESQPQR